MFGSANLLVRESSGDDVQSLSFSKGTMHYSEYFGVLKHILGTCCLCDTSMNPLGHEIVSFSLKATDSANCTSEHVKSEATTH